VNRLFGSQPNCGFMGNGLTNSVFVCVKRRLFSCHSKESLGALEAQLGEAGFFEISCGLELENLLGARAEKLDPLPRFCIEVYLNARIVSRGIVLDPHPLKGAGDLSAGDNIVLT